MAAVSSTKNALIRLPKVLLIGIVCLFRPMGETEAGNVTAASRISKEFRLIFDSEPMWTNLKTRLQKDSTEHPKVAVMMYYQKMNGLFKTGEPFHPQNTLKDHVSLLTAAKKDDVKAKEFMLMVNDLSSLNAVLRAHTQAWKPLFDLACVNWNAEPPPDNEDDLPG